jgi:HSP20 family protein
MDRLWGGGWPGLRESEGAYWPAVDISERDGKLIVRADLPGMNKDDVKVELSDGNLVIEGERKREHEEESKGFRRYERTYGSFYRSIPVPEGANLDEARAQFRNGVLEVSIPVPESKGRRTIPIEGETGERKQPGSEGQLAQREAKAR